MIAWTRVLGAQMVENHPPPVLDAGKGSKLPANPVAPRIASSLFALLASALVVFGLSRPAGAGELLGKFESLQHRFQLVKICDGLEHPWSLAFLPDGTMLVTERPGRLRRIAEGHLDPQPVAGVPPVYASGQGGLLDVVPHPRFIENRLIYLSYASPGQGGGATAVARGKLVGNRIEDFEELYVALPRTRGSRHFGSRLVFSGGHVFVTAGERGDPDRAQALDDPAGSVIRLHEDGRIPEDNPFVMHPGARPEIYTYGNRNPQGMAKDPVSGQLYLVEHGPKGGDELNLIESGENYGWPVITYGLSYSGFRIGEGTHKAGMAQPVHHWTPSISPSGLMIYDGDAFPNWRGSFFIGALSARLLDRLEIRDGKVAVEERLLEDWGRRIRDVRQGPDGLIYLLTDARNGMLLRLEPVE